MTKENWALKLVDEVILYYDARSKKHESNVQLRDNRIHVNVPGLCNNALGSRPEVCPHGRRTPGP